MQSLVKSFLTSRLMFHIAAPAPGGGLFGAPAPAPFGQGKNRRFLFVAWEVFVLTIALDGLTDFSRPPLLL